MNVFGRCARYPLISLLLCIGKGDAQSLNTPPPLFGRRGRRIAPDERLVFIVLLAVVRRGSCLVQSLSHGGFHPSIVRDGPTLGETDARALIRVKRDRFLSSANKV